MGWERKKVYELRDEEIDFMAKKIREYKYIELEFGWRFVEEKR